MGQDLNSRLDKLRWIVKKLSNSFQMRRIVSQTYLFVYQSSLLYDLIKLLIKSENHEIFIYCLIILVFTE